MSKTDKGNHVGIKISGQKPEINRDGEKVITHLINSGPFEEVFDLPIEYFLLQQLKPEKLAMDGLISWRWKKTQMM